MPTPTLTLLGPPQLRRSDSAPVAFRSRKELALLAYLAVEHGRPHRREALLALLWPDAPADAARNSLRVALANLRHALGPDSVALVVARQTVQLTPDRDGWLDVAAFRALLDACRAHPHPRAETCRACADRLAQAAGLYGGDFLAGFSLPDAKPFQEWAHVCGADLHQRAMDALAALAAAHEVAGNYQALGQCARRQLALEPWHEPAHRQLMRGLAVLGNRHAALAQYEACCAVLADELGVEPEAETRLLYERICAGELTAVFRDPTAPPRSLPTPLTPLVGRETELATLRAWRAVRLLTLVGAGGIGKTRLALELARELVSTYVDGVSFVPLSPLDTPDAIVPAIAAALQLTLQGDQTAALLHFLRDKELLLILDNFEHLIEGAALVPAILEGAPRVRVIVTSRERLNVRGEHVYAVEGLGYTLDSSAEALRVPAAQLFVHGAQRVAPGFALTAATAGDVLRICRLVQGMPLALELAAACVDSITLAQIAALIEQGSRVPEAEWRDAPERHQSMAAVFASSWRLLSAEEQQALCRLAVFRDGWTQEAAEAVAGVSPLVLRRLVRKSLAQRDGRQGAGGRYIMLEPLRQLALARLGASADELVALHGTYYLRLLAAQEAALIRDEASPALDALHGEFTNIRHAWAWASARADSAWELLEASLYAFNFYIGNGRYTESMHTYDVAVERLRGAVASGDGTNPARGGQRRLLGKLLTQTAVVAIGHGQYAKGYAEAQEAVAICRETGAVEGELQGGLLLAIAHMALGRDGAEAEMQAVLAQAREAQERSLANEMLRFIEWRSVYWMAWAAAHRGDALAARRWASEGIAISGRQGTQRGELSCLELLATAEWELGDDGAARVSLERIQSLARPFQYPSAEGVALYGFAELALRRGGYAEARELLERAVVVFRTAGDAYRKGLVLGSLTRLLLVLGEAQEAQARLEQLESLATVDVGHYSAWLAELVRALLAEHRGELAHALAAAERALAMTRQTRQDGQAADALVVIGRVHERAGRWEQAATAHAEALASYERLGLAVQTAEPLAGLARIALRRGDVESARRYAGPALAILAAHPWAGLGSPFALHLACYQALEAQHDPRAPQLLHGMRERLRGCLEQFAAERSQSAFIEATQAHRVLMRGDATTNGAR